MNDRRMSDRGTVVVTPHAHAILAGLHRPAKCNSRPAARSHR